MRGQPVWTVLLSRAVHVAMDFYREAVGWRFEPFSGTQYPCWLAKSGDETIVAVFVDASASDFPDAPELWLPCFDVAGLDRAVAEAERRGATILRPPLDIGAHGRVAVLRQPGGGIVAWRDPSPPA